MPFGSSCQQCPSLDLAQIMVQCGLAIALQAFDWSSQPRVKSEDMNMMEVFGLTCPVVEALGVNTKPRFSSKV